MALAISSANGSLKMLISFDINLHFTDDENHFPLIDDLYWFAFWQDSKEKPWAKRHSLLVVVSKPENGRNFKNDLFLVQKLQVAFCHSKNEGNRFKPFLDLPKRLRENSLPSESQASSRQRLAAWSFSYTSYESSTKVKPKANKKASQDLRLGASRSTKSTCWGCPMKKAATKDRSDKYNVCRTCSQFTFNGSTILQIQSDTLYLVNLGRFFVTSRVWYKFPEILACSAHKFLNKSRGIQTCMWNPA